MTTSGDGNAPHDHVAAAQLTNEIQRLANELFAAPPGPAPAATAVGAGGASPLVAMQPATQIAPTPAAVPSPDPSGTPTFDGGVVSPMTGLVPTASSATPIAHPFIAAPQPPEQNPFATPTSLHQGPRGPGDGIPDHGLDLGVARADAPSEGAPYFLEIARGTVAPNATPNLPGAAPDGPPIAPPELTHPHEPRSPFETSFSPRVVSLDDDPSHGTTPGLFDAHAVKKDFPILEETIRGKKLVWLDNAATTQKPNAVIDRLAHYYRHENSNVHRAAHTLAARSTDAYEGARNTTKRFLNAGSAEEVVFVRGTTEAINLVAKSWGARHVEAGDEIVVTHLEHHANIVPWQMLCAQKGAKLKVAPVDSRGQIILEEYEKLFTSRTKIASFTQVSNALGTITPAKEMVEIAHRWGACVLVDGAQAVSHMPVDVQALDCEFYVFSGHKIFGPTGIGALYGKRNVLAAMPPWQGGGNMIADVTFEKTTYQAPPWRFEAGTGNIADAVGLGAALDYVSGLGLPNIARHEHELRVYAEGCLREIAGLTIIGTAAEKAGVVSFVLDGVRTEDVGGMLDLEGIAVRSGHHCAQPILRRFGLEATVRASLAPYNTREDIDALVAAVRRIQLGRPPR